MAINVGDAAPSAELVRVGENGPEKVNITSLKGEKTVLLFFPLVGTGVCEAELCSVRDSISKYNDLDSKVIAISIDSPFAQGLWKEKENFNFDFWSDFNKEAITAFGNAHEELANLKGVSKRSAFVLDKDAVVQYAWVSDDPKQLPNFDEIQEKLANI
ncbi:MAG: redoxin domain-containing protein [Candidatus Lindowbacteria bacterium]|nr:redoxin domain-containing protein [Candidatus Lindowbacteria bacterium]